MRPETPDLSAFALTVIPLPPETAGRTKPVQLLKWGVNAPVDGRAPVVVDDAFGAALEQAFAARTVALVIDYNHASIFGFNEAPAAGWIQALSIVRPGQEAAGSAPGVWISADWTPAGQRRIRDKEFRYLSAVLRRDATTGAVLPELTGAGLTNTPAIHGLEVVAASARPFPATRPLPTPPPARFEAVDAGGGQLAFKCGCGWAAVMAPIAGGRFAVKAGDRELYDYGSRELAEGAIVECAREHHEACPRSGALQ